jgi:hypothetical protein
MSLRTVGRETRRYWASSETEVPDRMPWTSANGSTACLGASDFGASPPGRPHPRGRGSGPRSNSAILRLVLSLLDFVTPHVSPSRSWPHRVAFYARVSTTEQTPEPQLFAVRQYAAARGLEVSQEYVDEGVSGAKDRRPALDRLLADARRRHFDVLAVTKLDRLARSVRHLTALAAELEALGVDLIVLDQSIDTNTPASRPAPLQRSWLDR